MASLLYKRRQGIALRALLLEMAARHQVGTAAAGFQALGGEMIPYLAGELAIRAGSAVLVGGLLVGTVLLDSDEE